MMTTANTQPKWALIGVRVCVIYLALWAVAAILPVFIGSINNTFDWLRLLLILFAVLLGLLALRLWQLRSWSREFAADIFIGQMALSLVLLMNHTNWNSLTSVAISFAPAVVGVIGWVFLNRPAVKALFESHQ
jgi:hypothetical protein